MPTPLRIQQRRQIEDRLAQLGDERRELHTSLFNVDDEIRHELERARTAGISISDIAELVGISRQTLHRWLSPPREHDWRPGELRPARDRVGPRRRRAGDS